jgi:tripartite-type tricarboxylate transporter receptor subunit TctC
MIVRRAMFAAAFAPALPALAQRGFPNRPIRLLVPYTPGGGADIAARLLAERLRERLGQPVVVENRPGANEILATEAVARSTPDGHTIGFVTNSLAINPALMARVPFDWERDLSPIGTIARVPFVLVVHPSVPAATLPELLALLRARPGALSYASLGPGSAHGLAMEWLRHLAGVEIVAVPYRGLAPAMTAVAANETQIMFTGLTAGVAQVEAGLLRAIAVSPAAGVPAQPGWPPIARDLPGFDLTTWYALAAPAGVPEAIVETLSAAVRAALQSAEIRERFAAVGVEPTPSTPEAMAALVREEAVMWRRVARLTGARIE